LFQYDHQPKLSSIPYLQIIHYIGEKMSDTLPMIGREYEMECLQSNIGHAIRGKGSIVFISGEAGIGKNQVDK